MMINSPPQHRNSTLTQITMCDMRRISRTTPNSTPCHYYSTETKDQHRSISPLMGTRDSPRTSISPQK